jgi:glutathione S-transferase
LETVRSEFKFVTQLLSDGRPFICGQQFTAADLTFVSLALPVLNVPYATLAPICDPSVFIPPPEMAAASAELQGFARFPINKNHLML